MLITGSLLDQDAKVSGTKVSDTKVSLGGYKGNSGEALLRGLESLKSVYTKASHFVVFGQTDRMKIYQFIVSIKITYCEISNVIVINLGSNME